MKTTSKFAVTVSTNPQSSEPCLLTKAQEMEKFVSVLESRLARTAEIIFGTNTQEPKRDTVVSIEGIVADCCARIASLCGECATINQKLSGQEEQ